MRSKTRYQEAKEQLKIIALNAKKRHPKDFPYQRMIINDSAHNISRDLKLSEYQQFLLHNYASTLHPKK